MTEGKRHEANFASSCKAQNVWYLKLKDTFIMDKAMGLPTNIQPFDFLVHYLNDLIAVECKSTLGKSISFQLTPDDPKAQIASHQILALHNFENYENQIAGLLIQWRDFDETYWVRIQPFLDWVATTDRKSLPYTVCQEIGVLVPQYKKRVNYIYDITILNKTEKEVN